MNLKAKSKKRTRKRQPSPRAKTEQMLGHMMLKGKIPVVPPNLLRCPVPSAHVKDFEGLCKEYADGKISESDVLAKVGEALKTLKKPVGEQPSTSTSGESSGQ